MRKPKLSKTERNNRFSLTLTFVIVIFVILATSIAVASATAHLFSQLGWMGLGNSEEIGFNLTPTLVYLSITSIVIGIGITFLAIKYPLKPLNRMINQINRLASGDFKARLKFGRPLSAHPTFKEISESFNKMAEELEGTEMLRSDFVNNFSHEFKTPIVSIAGFAKLLRRGNLTKEQKEEYLAIIEEESLRLASMASNVLSLTKVENQTILTEVKVYNLSEQIRSCLLLLENKWTKKNTEFSLEFGEVNISADEELLKQVWINLLDNAIKFSPEGSAVEIFIAENDDTVSVKITNTGSEISQEHIGKIFGKFYQADESHSGEGNGVGLAVVKRIVELHSGKVTAESENNTTTFTIFLPKAQ